MEETPEYTRPKQLPDYQLGRCRVLALFDYKVLGQSYKLELDWPPTSYYQQPHHIPQGAIPFVGESADWEEFRFYSWLSNTQALGLPISEESVIWFEHLSTKSHQAAVREFLAKYKEESEKKPYDLSLWFNPPGTASISSITIEIPEDLEPGEWTSALNTFVKDSRKIPPIIGSHPIKEFFIKKYLEDRLREYLLLGGIRELIEWKELQEQGHKLPDPFYWDLWADVDNLRKEYLDHCAWFRIDLST